MTKLCKEMFEEANAAVAVNAETAENAAAAFNYAVLSVEMGDYLKKKEQQLRNEYMNFTANCGAIFAEAQEKLAGINQHDGMFEKWIVSMGFSKSTVYRMISVYNFCSSQIETSNQQEIFNSLTKSLQYEISKPSAPKELVTAVLDGDITRHADYIKAKKELDEANKRYSNVLTENQQLRRDRVAALNRADNAERELEKARNQIEELESRPVDVAVEDNTAAVDELNDKIYSLNATMSNLEKQLKRFKEDFRRDFMLCELHHRAAVKSIRDMRKLETALDECRKNIGCGCCKKVSHIWGAVPLPEEEDIKIPD